MSQVIFMCGPAGSGKSTYALCLQERGMTRLSIDEEMWRRGQRVMPPASDVRHDVETDLRRRLLDLVASGDDVVLDFSFWSRRMRDDYRRLLEPSGVIPETVYLATSREIVIARMRARRGTHPNDYVLPDDVVAAYFDGFEPPTHDEGPLRIIVDEPREGAIQHP